LLTETWGSAIKLLAASLQVEGLDRRGCTHGSFLIPSPSAGNSDPGFWLSRMQKIALSCDFYFLPGTQFSLELDA
jgi:hypothetical protein